MALDCKELLDRALAIFERIGDRTGVMSTVISMAYASYGPVMHLSNSAKHLEEIRRVTSRVSEMVTESERLKLELQMLFGVHVYSRAKVVPDLALSRGEDAHRAARLQGERSIEFLAAGGVAMTLLEIGDIAGAERWLGLASAAASVTPSRSRSIQLETWRGMVGARSGDEAAMREHLEKALALATDSGRAAARCEALARLALEGSRLLGRTETPDPALVDLVERSAGQVKELITLLPGHAPWGAEADAALATLALVRGDVEAAVAAGGSAFGALQAGLHEDVSLEIILPAARAVFAGGSLEGKAFVRRYLKETLSRIAQGPADEQIRVAWLNGPTGRELVELAGPMDLPLDPSATTDAETEAEGPILDETERRLLQLLTEGRTNAEIAVEMDCTEDQVAGRLTRLYARLGTSGRAEATSLAFRGLANVGSG
jgi:DNA-binding CsgD family transcriptional regulator